MPKHHWLWTSVALCNFLSAVRIEVLTLVALISQHKCNFVICGHINRFITMCAEHGNPQIFFQGGQNFTWGAKTYYLPKKHLKDTFFPQKRWKHTILVGQRGARVPLLPSPADAYDNELYETIFRKWMTYKIWNLMTKSCFHWTSKMYFNV